jgi:hypothetical protein
MKEIEIFMPAHRKIPEIIMFWDGVGIIIKMFNDGNTVKSYFKVVISI